MAARPELKLYNTLTRRKDPFTPIDPDNVRMYVCGPTVYDFAHIGNARPVIVFDVLYRLLRHLYGEKHVTYVRNVTDVDDKINARAAELSIPIRELTDKTLTQFHEDVAALGCLPPTHEPRATESIGEMKAMIERLVAAGHAYVAEEHVLFDVASMPDYGRLSNRSLEEMRAGARVEVAPYKRGPMDFVLWKPSRAGEPAWPSPCGIATPGRPGWHIECSAMADRYLWDEVKDRLSPEARARSHVFDIHGGGIDLVFPHHENELAQSRCAHGTEMMANFWLHNGFLQVEGRKMAKSEGNFVTIRDLLEGWPGDVIRLNMLKTHYRQPIDWTVKGLEESQQQLRQWNEAIAKATSTSVSLKAAVQYATKGLTGYEEYLGIPSDEVMSALADDLNTPSAIAAIHVQLDTDVDNVELLRSGISAMELLGFRNFAKPSYFQSELSTALRAVLRNVVSEENYTHIARLEKSFRLARANGLETRLIEQLAARLGVEFDETSHGFVFVSPLSRNADLKDKFHSRKSDIERRISARLSARKNRNFATADRIRDELAAEGINLEDYRDPETGEMKTKIIL